MDFLTEIYYSITGFFNFIGYLFYNIKILLIEISRPFDYLLNFLTAFFNNIFSAPVPAGIDMSDFSTSTLALFTGIPYFAELKIILLSIIIIFALKGIIDLIKSIL